MEHSEFVDGGNRLQIWKVATDISNKQSWKVDKGCPSSWGLGEGLTTPHSKNLNMLQIMHDSRLPAWHK